MERIEKLKSFLAETPNDSFLKHALALEYIKLGNDDDAQKLFEDILANEPHYVGSYYHLGKLFERKGDQQAAILTYEKGMHIAKEAREMHAYNELQAAYEDLVY
ncbi:tetratricopeptide repeat protein [Chitinophaga skermanii]|uniref:Tetratricopeptide repeat protein n=1 Tax=Chitinophaga skermanii TaxID=331697 RepID=A0A327QR08_9BACT|nr:tetratricopeptide repeat protein [Chitinophaga skermanii]RAJ06999.1 tetratricopeptide repeat protein [Chitinophaga skermanii]